MTEKKCNIQFIFNFPLICGMNYMYSSKIITCCQCSSAVNGNHAVSYNDTSQCICT